MTGIETIRRPGALAEILERTAALGFGMGSEELTGMFLRTLAASKPGGRFLEIGTGTGIATAWLLDGMTRDARLTTVDSDAEVQAVARGALGGDARLTIVTEDAAGFLARQESASYDLIFADAMPGKYEGLDDALRLVRAGGIYVIDDLLPQSNWPDGHAAKVPVLIEKLQQRPDFLVAPIAWASGLLLAVKRAD